jgi:DNA-binding NarL/FixJ family response regulator
MRFMATRVLIIDDHAEFRGLARRLLEEGGFVVVGEAGDGRETKAAVAELRPDVVLLDVQLPDIDGFEVADAIAAEAGSPIVVLTSSRDAADFGSRLARSPARGFIPKSRLSGAALEEVLRA